jgi:SAM-dependent methyltransferase
MTGKAIEVHPSVHGGGREQELIASLQANRIDPKLLYVTPRQTGLWRQVFLRHSPIHTNPEFARIYADAFARTSDRLPPGKIALVGLGCGTGLKERDLYAALTARGHEAKFSAIDVSRDLVIESMQKLAAAGAEQGGNLVCDLAETEFISEWLDRTTGTLPRLMTFFGLVPNLAPALVARIFRAILRPGDRLLVSVHLAPVVTDLAEAMQTVLPQYDNAETRAWLAAALEQFGLEEVLGAPEIAIGEVEGIPAFLAMARWRDNARDPLQFFRSLRYTPALFEDVMKREGFRLEQLAMTACREEAIWAIG